MAVAGDWMAGGGRTKQFALRLIAVFLLLVGLVVLSVPFFTLLRSDQSGLIDDTRAQFSSAAAIPAEVSCVSTRSGTSYRGITSWECVVDPRADEPAEAPNAAGMSFEEVMAKNLREVEKLVDPAETSGRPGRLERDLPANLSGEQPTLRRLSADGEPARFGIAWGGGALALHWLSWAFVSLIFWGLGAACLFAARVGWKRTRR